MTLSVTLFYDTMRAAKEAGFPDAVLVDDDVPEWGYMAVATFECDGWEAESE